MKKIYYNPLKFLGVFVFGVLLMGKAFAHEYYFLNNTLSKLSVQSLSADNDAKVGQSFTVPPHSLIDIKLIGINKNKFQLTLANFDPWNVMLAYDPNAPASSSSYISVDGPSITAMGGGKNLNDPMLYAGKEWGYFAETVNGQEIQYTRPIDTDFQQTVKKSTNYTVSYHTNTGTMAVQNILPGLTVSLQCPHTLPGGSIHRCVLKSSLPIIVKWAIQGGRILKEQPTPSGINTGLGPLLYQLPNDDLHTYSVVNPIDAPQENILGIPVQVHQGNDIDTAEYGISADHKQYNIDIFFDDGPALSEITATFLVNQKFYEISVPIILVQPYVYTNEIEEARNPPVTSPPPCDEMTYSIYSNYHFAFCKENDGQEAVYPGILDGLEDEDYIVARAQVAFKGPTISGIIRGMSSDGNNAVYMLYRQYIKNENAIHKYYCGAKKVKIYYNEPAITDYLTKTLRHDDPPPYLNHLYDGNAAEWRYVNQHLTHGFCRVLKYGFTGAAYPDVSRYEYLVYGNRAPSQTVVCRLGSTSAAQIQELKVASEGIISLGDFPNQLILTKTGARYTLANSKFSKVSFGKRTQLPQYSNCDARTVNLYLAFALYLDAGTTSELVSTDPMPANTKSYVANWYADFHFPEGYYQYPTGYYYADAQSQRRLIQPDFKAFGHRTGPGTTRGASDMFYKPTQSLPGGLSGVDDDKLTLSSYVPMLVHIT